MLSRLSARHGPVIALLSAVLWGTANAAPAGGAGAAPPGPTPLAPGAVLERLSMKLRGTPPTAEETASFTKAVAANPDQFLDLYSSVVDGYLASSAFRQVVEQIHEVWWKVNPGESAALAGYIVANDHPYFELFQRDYVYLDGTTAAPYSEAGIATEGALPTTAGDWRAVRLAPGETRFRSILSDQDFLNTFPDTATNKNRKRANQIFHTFLCETLAPTLPPSPLPNPTDPTDPHGTDPNCVGCHYRLDPLARFFDHWRPPQPNTITTWFDPAQAAAGDLIVLDAGGGIKQARGAAESDLGKILAAEPKVQACVAQQLWSYLLGPAVVLDDATSAQLVQALDHRQSYKDLVKQAVLHPYFWSTASPPPPRFADVKAFLGVCVQCHSPTGDVDPQFDPSRYPFLTDHGANAALLVRIWGAINHAPAYAPMPLAPVPALPADTLARIREWIAAGANDDSLAPTLTDAQIQEVLNDD